MPILVYKISFNGLPVSLPILTHPTTITLGNTTFTLTSIPINPHPYSLIGLNLLPPDTPHRLLSLIYPTHFTPLTPPFPHDLMVSAAQKGVGLAKVSPLQLTVIPGKQPVWQGERHQKSDAQTAIAAQLTELLTQKIIGEITEQDAREGGWCSNLLVVPRKDADGISKLFRVTLDARKINEATLQFEHPFPHLTDRLRDLSRYNYFGDIDFISCLWSFNLSPTASIMTTFVALGRYFRFHRMPFGLKQAPLWCQSVLERIMSSFQFTPTPYTLLIYLDEFVFSSPTADSSHQLLLAITEHLKGYGFELHEERARHSHQSIEVLGMVLSHLSLAPAPSRSRDLFGWCEQYVDYYPQQT
eukprot:GHVN01050114.1.p1 GENE.GHVN01050114.1~~GHVN01050114.1.p1  ORF type:complete len:357 (+),score=31.99 GHVN01050114.1:317-1387(+)